MNDLTAASFFRPHVAKLASLIEAEGDELHDRVSDALWEFDYLPVRNAWKELPGHQQTRVLDHLLAGG